MSVKRKISSEPVYRMLLVAAITLFIGYFTYVSFLRHDNIHSLRLDLGNMDQTVWNVLHGNGFTLTEPMGTSQVSRLSIHADFLLILIAPLYLIWSNPKMLLIIQATALAFGALPIYWIAKKVLRHGGFALLFSLMYLLYPTIQMNTMHDFHATSLTTTFLLLAFWYYISERPVIFLFYAVLAALGKEQFWAVTALLGLAWIIKPRFRLFGSIVTVLSAVVFYLLFWMIIPSVTPVRQHWALTYLSEYGGSLNEILHSIIFHPYQTISTIVARDRLFYYFQLLAPVGFLSLFAPVSLLFSVPNLVINVLSSQKLMRMIDYQYTSGITPWIFVSAIYGFARLQKFMQSIRILGKYRKWLLISLVFVCSVISVHYWGDLPYGVRSRFWFFRWAPPEAQMVREVASGIPSKYSVSATNNIGAHFSQRQYLYNFPVNAATADYVAVELGDQYAWPSGAEQQRVLQLLLEDGNYELIAHTGSFSALKRRSL